jgi:hypothetical protein
MANRFGGGNRDMKRSNGATDAFLSVLQFALSDLAATVWQRALAQWIAWHDQNLVGRGAVGFYLEEIAWDRFEFPNQKAFLLRAIDTALTHYRWEELCYEPPYAEGDLREYREIVELFELPAETGPSERWAWPGPDDDETFCPNHQVHCSDYGWCRVCDECGTAGTDGQGDAAGS